MTERRDYGNEFARVPIAASEDGTPLRVEDIATVVDGFEDSDRFARYNGKSAVMLDIYRVGVVRALAVPQWVQPMMLKPCAKLLKRKTCSSMWTRPGQARR